MGRAESDPGYTGGYLGHHHVPVNAEYPDTGLVSESQLDSFLRECRFSHWHWGYQPIRTHSIQFPDGELHRVFDISGSEMGLLRWDDPSRPVVGWNGKIAEECFRPLLEYKVFSQPEFGFQMSPSIMDWLRTYDIGLWRGIRDALASKPAFASSYTQNILPAQPHRVANLLIKIGIQIHSQEFGRKPFGFWPAELAVTPETLSQLSENGISVLILKHNQLDITEQAPLYRLPTAKGRSIIVIPYSEEVSGRYGFQNNEAGSYAAFLAEKAYPGKGVATGANDLETLGHHRRSDSIEFAKWLYTVYLPRMRDQGTLTWQRDLRDARMARLKPVSSWSCPHGIGRWTGDPGCNCDGATYEIQKEKSRLHTQLSTEMTLVTDELDDLNRMSPRSWEQEYIDWFMRQRAAIARGLPVRLGSKDRKGVLFLRLYNATVGDQSCSYYFNGSYERNMAHACVREMEALRSYDA